jgi:hypothetical protein
MESGRRRSSQRLRYQRESSVCSTGSRQLSDPGRTESESTSPNKVASTAAPIPAKPQMDDFKALVTEYGRSIIKSAMDHSPEEAVSLKNDIITAKEKVIVKYKTVENDLEIAEGENRILKANVDELLVGRGLASQGSRMQRIAIKDLEGQLRYQRERTSICSDSLEKETNKRKTLEVELGDLKKDKKRKRESVAAIWEDAEKVKLN